MNKTFEALKKLIPDSEILDFNIFLNDIENNQFSSVEEYDEALAEAIKNAKEIDIRKFFP